MGRDLSARLHNDGHKHVVVNKLCLNLDQPRLPTAVANMFVRCAGSVSESAILSRQLQ